MVKCENCEKELDEEEIGFNWHFGKIWFCGNSCATSWSVKQHLKKKEEAKNGKRRSNTK